MASDTPYQNLLQYFPTCNDFIHNARTQGGNVLIHCLAGMSRSVTIAVAYIMSITTLQLNESQKVLRGARPVSCPNTGFQKQLQEFEGSKLFEERRRMLEKFPGTTFLEIDEEYCKRLLASYNKLLISRSMCEGRCTSIRTCPTGACRARFSPSRLQSLQSTESPSPRHISQKSSPSNTGSGSKVERKTSTNSSSSSSSTHNTPFRTISCPNTPLKSIRENRSNGCSSATNDNNNHENYGSSHRSSNNSPGASNTTPGGSSSRQRQQQRRHLPSITPLASTSHIPTKHEQLRRTSSTTQSSSSTASPHQRSSWERHYGCLNTTILRNRSQDEIISVSVSTPPTPMHYPRLTSASASSSPSRHSHGHGGHGHGSGGTTIRGIGGGGGRGRTDSVASIASVSSIMSLPAQSIINSSTSGGSSSSPGSIRPRCNSPMPSFISSPNNNNIHSTNTNNLRQVHNIHRYGHSSSGDGDGRSGTPLSCPPAPRRTPGTPRRLPASPIILASRGRQSPLATFDDFDDVLTVVIEPNTGAGGNGGQSSNSGLSTNNEFLQSSSNKVGPTSSQDLSHWAISPNSYHSKKYSSSRSATSTPEIIRRNTTSSHDHSHGHHHSSSTSGISSGSGGGNNEPINLMQMVRTSQINRQPQRGAGITRWVMKRSAYRYTMDNSYK